MVRSPIPLTNCFKPTNREGYPNLSLFCVHSLGCPSSRRIQSDKFNVFLTERLPRLYLSVGLWHRPQKSRYPWAGILTIARFTDSPRSQWFGERHIPKMTDTPKFIITAYRTVGVPCDGITRSVHQSYPKRELPVRIFISVFGLVPRASGLKPPMHYAKVARPFAA